MKTGVVLTGVEQSLRALARYHQYEAHGLENIPRTGGAIVAFHHSLATYDSFLLGVPVNDRLGRRFVSIADRLVFRTPVLRRVFTEAGFVSAGRKELVHALAGGALIGVAPGGTREMLRGPEEKYRFDWQDRLGFVWISLMSGAPIVLAACPRGDDIFDVVSNPLTARVYERFQIPLPLFRGRFGLPIPRPVKLWHLLSEAIYPPVSPEEATVDVALRHHAHLTERMKRLMIASRALGDEPER